MKTAALLLLPAAALTLWPGQPTGADTPSRYRMTVLPLVFGSAPIDVGFDRGGINARGQVTGMVVVLSSNPYDRRAALWQQGRLQVLDKTPVKYVEGSEDHASTYAAAVNAQGDAAGGYIYSFTGAYSGGGTSANARYQGNWIALGPFPTKDDTDSEALGINDREDIVGDFGRHFDSHLESVQETPTPLSVFTHYAFLWHRGRVKKLWQGSAVGINNRGEIIGSSTGGGLLWRGGKITLLRMDPAAINERGEIAGNISLISAITDTTGKACIWRRGRLTRLSPQNSHAYALNNSAQVVGEVGSRDSWKPTRAALWRDDRAYDLNRCVSLPKGWVLERALGINDHGWIIGEGSVYKSPKDKQPTKTFTFLLTPK